MEGAEFEVKFYDKMVDTIEELTDEKAMRSWVLKLFLERGMMEQY